MSEITRDRIEKALWEATGFKGDTAVIDALMVVIEAWAVQMAEGLAASPVTVREGHVHLLVQQAELLLDSAGRLQLTGNLAENVTFLTGLTDGMQLRMQQLAAMVARLQQPDPVVLTPPEPVSTETLQGWLADDDGTMPPWERDLIEKAIADRIPETPGDEIPEAAVSVPEDSVSVPVVLTEEVKQEVQAVLKPKQHRKPAPQVFEMNGTLFLHCQGDCDLDRPVTDFFVNGKSASGYESKCKFCRKIKAA